MTLAVLALALAGIAQYLIGSGELRWAIAPYVVALGAILLATARTPLTTFSVTGTTSSAIPSGVEVDTPAPILDRIRRLVTRERGSERFLGFGAIVLSLILMAVALRSFSAGPSNTVGWYAYGISSILALLALPSLDGRWTVLVARLKQRYQVSLTDRGVVLVLVLLVILLFALTVRLYHLDQLPAGLWFDEADNLVQASRIEQDPGAALVFVRSTNLPSLFLMPIAAIIEFTGVSMTAGRLVSVAFGVATIAVVFLMTRMLLGPFMGLVAAFLTAVMRWEINWSRIGMHGITAPFFAALTFYLMLRALRSDRVSDYGFAGAALGIGMWFYTSFRMFPLVIMFLLVHHIVVNRPAFRKLLANLLVAVAVALFLAAPVVQSAVTNSGEFFARTNDTSIFSLMPLGDAVGQMWDSLGVHALMFNEKGDPNPRHNLPDEPMLDPISGLLLLLGLGIALSRWRSLGLVSLPFWIFFMVLPGVLTLPFEAPQSLRSITVIPAVIALITLAISVVWREARRAPWPAVRRIAPVGLALILAVIAYMNINTYFGAQAQDPDVFASFSTDETLMARHMVRQQRRGYSLFTSRQFRFGLTTAILANNPRFEVIRVPDEIPIDPARVWNGASIYLEPREASVFRILQTYYPDAEFETVRPPGGGEALYYSAVISREQLENPLGLNARQIAADGVLDQFLEMDTERVWLDVEPDQLPMDIVWEGTLHITQPGEYQLVLESDIESMVELDGVNILGGDTKTITIVPAIGLHSLEIRGTVDHRAAFLRVLWKPPEGSLTPIPANNLFHGAIRPLGLAGQFYRESTAAQVPDASHVTPAMDVFYYDPVLPEPYFAVWQGRLHVSDADTYRFRLQGAGTVKLYVDDRFVAEYPEASNPGPPGARRLGSGPHDIRVEYISPSPPSQFEVLWASTSTQFEPIPIELLSPATDQMFRVVESAGQ